MSLRAHYKKTALCIAISVASGITDAELQWLDETALSGIRGQAGLTIDIETKETIGEFEYVDAGSMFIRDIRLEGIDGGYVDNIRARIDITNGSERLWKGFSDMAWLADLGFLDSNEADVAWALDKYKDSGTGEIGEVLQDGDLLIHVTSTDYGLDLVTAPTSADHASNLDKTKNAVDLKITEGEFGLRSSDGSVETVLTRNFTAEAYLGYLDIVVTNRGNGFHEGETVSEGEPANVLLGDSYIGIDVKFRVEDLDVDGTNIARNTFISRNVTNPLLTLRDMRIHNERGADTLGSFGYASVETKLGAATNILPSIKALEDLAATGVNNLAASKVDGMAFYDINVRWDWDLPHIQIGNNETSIGEVYFTDFAIGGTSLTISAH